MLRFKELYDTNSPAYQALPDLSEACPDAYKGVGLRDHCNDIHGYFKKHNILEKMQEAFQIIPDQVMKPSEAYHQVVRRNVEYVELDEMMGRTPAVMMVPYPPGIPIIMGGEMMNENARPIFEYLKMRQGFENRFPGYESDIHGVERTERDGKKFFRTLCVKK